MKAIISEFLIIDGRISLRWVEVRI